MALTKKKQQQQLIFGFIAVIIFVALIAAALVFSEEEGDIAKPKIAVIPVYGSLTLFDGKGNDVKNIVDLLKEANEDDSVKAIILEINSPGGSVVASKALADAVKQSKKPTVAWMRDVAASGGYWVASACDKVIADPATITGSIGVTGSYLQFSKLMENYGVTYERLVSGPYKDAGSPYKELTPAEREMLMKKINAINSMFINAISENRNLSKSYVSNLATGEIFLGSEAYELKLVDVLGGEKEAQKTAEQLAGISESKLVQFKKKVTLLDLFSASAEKSAYWIGRGIGDSWNLLLQEEDYSIKAEI